LVSEESAEEKESESEKDEDNEINIMKK